MSELVIRDYTSYVEDLLPSKFTDHEDLKTLLQIHIDNNNILYEELLNISDSTDIDIAVGYQLDYIGRLVGAFREGRSDEEYRRFIRLQRAINNSNGTSNDLLNLLKDISQSDRTNIWELPYNAATLATYGSTNDYANLVKDIDKLAPAGTRISAIIKYEEGNIVPASGNAKLGRFVQTEGTFEFGDSASEFGSEAEFGPMSQILYNKVEGVEGCYLATNKDFYGEFNTSAGEAFMQAGEQEAIAGGSYYLGDSSEMSLATSHVLSYQRDGKI